jgi:replication factor C small subunit
MSFFANDINKREHSLWVEKYRPQTLADYVGNETIKETIQQYLDNNDIPHLLLYGKAGTGKTTLAKLIVNTIKCDFMIINASDENNVDTVRNKVKGFASSVGFSGFKVIILDEFDYMTPNAQAILRNLMETFSKHCRFILTCNYIEKIIDPIQSRCQSFAITPPTKKDVAIQVSKILDAEKITYDIKNVADIVSSYYPDIRRILNTCQLQSAKGELKVDHAIMVESNFQTKLIELLKSSNDKRNLFINIRQAVADNRLNDYSEMYSMLYDKVDDYAAGNTANVILTIADGLSKDALVVDKEIVFMSTIIQILNIHEMYHVNVVI